MKYFLVILSFLLLSSCKKEVVSTEKIKKDFFYRLVTKDLDGIVTYSPIERANVLVERLTTESGGISSGTQTNDGGHGQGSGDDEDDDLIGTPLPLLLDFFRVSSSGNKVILNWKTSFEEDVVCFYIDRSEDGSKFTRIKSVKPKGPGEYREEDIVQ